MSAPVTHINLLQRTRPANTVALGLAGLLAVTILAMLAYGANVRGQARTANSQREAVAQQLDLLKARMAAERGEQSKVATTQALRSEVDAMRPEAQAATALLQAVRSADAGRPEEFSLAIAALTRSGEPGLWLTSLSVSEAGKRLDLKGGARDGTAVLRFARRANESLAPLMVHLDSLELQPLAAGAASAPNASSVSFHLF